MACSDYTGLLQRAYDWQTIIAGIGAVFGGWLAYRAGVKQADATRSSARDQIAAIEQQNADLKLAGQRRLAQERKDVAGLLYASVGIVIAQIENARKGLTGLADDPLPTRLANAIHQAVGKPGFTYLWERLGVFEGEIVVAFLRLEMAIDLIHKHKDDTDVGLLKFALDGLSTLAERLRALASGEMERAQAILPADELTPRL